MTLEELNTLSHDKAKAWFANTCTATKWCDLMSDQRPFDGVEGIIESARNNWQKMGNDDVLEALSGHPMIGDLASLRAKYANTKALAKNEQSGMQQASDDVLLRMQQLNRDYLCKHGFIFIICASGLSADAMLNELEKRLPNTTEKELAIAAAEQLKITEIRINKAFNLH